MSDSLMTFIAVVVLIYAAFLRLRELQISKINQKKLEVQGYSRKDDHLSYLNMVSLHASFFVAALLEIFFLSLANNIILQIAAFVLFLCAQGIRYTALTALGQFWNTNIMANSAKAEFVKSGPYRFIRHPNYLAVIIEFLSIPLIAGAWRTAIFYSIWNALVLRKRIVSEEAELFKIQGYQNLMSEKKRFIPGVF